MRAKPARARQETTWTGKPKHRRSRCLHPRLMAFFPSPRPINNQATFHWSSPRQYRKERTTQRLQELSWDVPLNRSEEGRTFMHRQSQGVGLTGRVVVAYSCASRSRHRLALLYNLASQIENTVTDLPWHWCLKESVLKSTTILFLCRASEHLCGHLRVYLVSFRYTRGVIFS